jgi:uncharacterized protein (DUF924 family)
VVSYHDVLKFWFEEINPEDWYNKDENLDLKMTERFIALHSAVVACECSSWRVDPEGRLAEILVIDQFSRNIYREDPKAFIYDPMALALAQETIRGNHHKNFNPFYRQFLYMPFMHSESQYIHNTSMLLFSEPGLEDSFQYELQHKDIIDRFGRYPHRNKILNRVSTPEEEEFLKTTDNIFESNNGRWQSITIEQSISVH